jgi:hypothetical protein
MATIHPDVAFLLDGLIPTPLASLADDAITLIAAEPEAGPFEGAIGRRINPREREVVLRQVDLIEQAVFFRIKAERHFTARIRDLAEGLELKRVTVLGADPDDHRAFADGGMDVLTSPEREEAILAFAQVYADALSSVRRRWRRGE